MKSDEFCDDEFKKAYKLLVVDNEPDKAINLCRNILRKDPMHLQSLMLIGCVLADSNNLQKINEGRQLFLSSLDCIDNINTIQSAWLEENPIYQMALWEQKNGNKILACVFYFVDAFIIQNKISLNDLHGITSELKEDDSLAIRSLLNLLERIVRP